MSDNSDELHRQDSQDSDLKLARKRTKKLGSTLIHIEAYQDKNALASPPLSPTKKITQEIPLPKIMANKANAAW